MSQHIAIFALVAFCLSTVVVAEGDYHIANYTQFLLKQKSVYELLWHVDQPEKQPEHYANGRFYSIRDNLANYTNQGYVEDFLALYDAGMLLRGKTFSIFYPTLLEEAKALFRVFYYAENFETLYLTAAWARIHVNEGLFAYAFSVAVTHHKDTYLIRVPAYHEIFPHLYFDDGVIRQAYDAKSSFAPGTWTIIPASNHSEYTLKYYTDDIAANDVPYYAHLVSPFWLPTEEFGSIRYQRGVIFFTNYKFRLAHYYAQRLSNGLGEIEDFDWGQRIPYGFNPDLSYPDGFSFPQREGYSYVPSYNYKPLRALRDYEYRISSAVDMGYVFLKNGSFSPIYTPEGVDILGSIFEGNNESVNIGLYGNYDEVARSVLGWSPKPHDDHTVFPSVMEYYGLDQRDPIYWSYIKKLVGYYGELVSHFPEYTKEQLGFPGVKIESVQVDKVTTYFTPYDYFISGAVKLQQDADDKALIYSRQHRLTHKPYNYQITVSSTAIRPNTSISIFLGPKFDYQHKEIDIADNWNNFFLIDQYLVDLTVGSHVYTRSSKDSSFLVPDEISGDLFYKKIVDAIAGEDTYVIPEHLYGYPERMALPKGHEDGLPMQFFFFVSPSSETPISPNRYFADPKGGFPFDRPPFPGFDELSNAYFHDFEIFHKNEYELNKV